MNRVTLIVTGTALAAILGLGALALSPNDPTPSPTAPAPTLSAKPAAEDDGCTAYRARGIACEAIAFEAMEITADPNPGHELAKNDL
ncbi:MAG: hypothetical protein JNJ59_12540 [Deltaproteobacteria bacterium]|jgi:hypothetical protein|nr:hypothetical protein [Deltaproteobacteria bacterium]